RGLEDGVDAAAQTDFLTDLDTVDGVELDVVVGNQAFYLAGQVLLQLLVGPLAVQQEGAALLHILNDGVLGDVSGVVAGNEVCLVDIVGGFDLGFTKPQVGNGNAAGLLGVVSEVRLGVHVGVVADD